MEKIIQITELEYENLLRDQILLQDIQLNSDSSRARLESATKGSLYVWGDSWVTDWGVQKPLKDMGYEWNKNADVSSGFCSYGRKIQEMASQIDTGSKFITYLEANATDIRKAKAILLSGGGNDSVRQTLLQLVNPKGPNDMINQIALDDHLDKKIILSYEKIIRKIDEILGTSKTPIVIHGYDFAIPFTLDESPSKPDNRTLNGIGKAWLRTPLFDGLHYDEQDGKKIMKELLSQLNAKLKLFASQNPSRVLYVDLTKTLQEKWDDQTVPCWRDNMHPNIQGRIDMAKKISDAIEQWHRDHPKDIVN